MPEPLSRAQLRAGPGPAPGRGRRRRQSRGDIKEAAILDCAWRLLATTAVADITIEALAAGAGISRSAFYFYFDSREAVIRALGERVAAGLTDTVTASPGPMGTRPQATARQMVAAYLERWRTEGPVLRAMSPLYESDAEHRAFWDEISDRIRRTIATAIDSERAAGRAPPAPPTSRDIASAIMAMMWRSGYELSLSPPSDAADAQRAEVLTTMCMRMIYGERFTGRLPD
jgi:TetR/AcrR family transcriptional regulator, ethionamide resistance regulator